MWKAIIKNEVGMWVTEKTKEGYPLTLDIINNNRQAFKRDGMILLGLYINLSKQQIKRRPMQYGPYSYSRR